MGTQPASQVVGDSTVLNTLQIISKTGRKRLRSLGDANTRATATTLINSVKLNAAIRS